MECQKNSVCRTKKTSFFFLIYTLMKFCVDNNHKLSTNKRKSVLRFQFPPVNIFRDLKHCLIYRWLEEMVSSHLGKSESVE